MFRLSKTFGMLRQTDFELTINAGYVNAFLELFTKELSYEEFLVFRKAWNRTMERFVEAMTKKEGHFLVPEYTPEQWENVRKHGYPETFPGVKVSKSEETVQSE